jgi:hypothetical protein
MLLPTSARHRVPRRGLVAGAVSLAVVTLAAVCAPAAQAGTAAGDLPAPTTGHLAGYGSADRPGWTSVTVQLAAQDQSALAALAGTPTTSHELRRAVLASAGPSRQSAAAVARFLTGRGFTITGTTAFSVTASGPQALVREVFPASARRRAPRLATRAEGAAATAAVSPLVVPAALEHVVSFAVGGPDTGPAAHPLLATASTPRFTLAPITGASARALYSVPAAALTAPAMGITIATIQLSGWDSTDLTRFAHRIGVPDPVRSGQYQAVSIDGANPARPDGNGGEREFALDQEALLAVAPSARQVAYVAPNTTRGFVDAFNRVAQDALTNRAGLRYTALSVSWGSCESSWTDGELNAMHAAIANVVAAGVSVFVASGDSGAYDCSTPLVPDNTLAVDFPASDPYVTAVGGLSTDPVARTETSWWEPTGSVNGYRGQGGGGGMSDFWALPSWQQGRVSGATQRLVPDISLDANPSSGLTIVVDGSLSTVGGTSLAAPLAAATMTDQQIAAGASTTYGMGNISPLLFRAPATALRDTTSGTNGYYSAGPGYDLATGLGAPLWSRLDPRPPLGVSSRYFPVGPCRVLDTRAGTSTCPGAGAVRRAPLSPSSVLRVKVAGVAGVPANATAVVLNLTAIAVTPALTYVTAWATGAPRPGVSTLNVDSRSAVPNLAIVPVGADGTISVYNAAGAVNLLADLSGYFAPSPGSSLTTGPACRVFDTRTGIGTCAGAAAVAKAPLGPKAVMTVKVAGVGGVPADATAVVLNLTAVGASTSTYLSAWPGGAVRPMVSSLNAGSSPAVPNLAIVPVGADGTISLYNANGTVDLVADLTGYFSPGAGASLTTTRACRVFDTRTGIGDCAGARPVTKATLGPKRTLRVQVTGVGGVPANATAVVLNLTAVGASTSTYLTAWPTGSPRPSTSTVNAASRSAVPNLAIVPVGADGTVSFYNAAGTVHLLADIAGYLA